MLLRKAKILLISGLTLSKITKMSSTYLTQKLTSFFNSLLNNYFSTCDINTLANNGPKGLPIATPSICWYNKQLNKNMLSLVHNSGNRFKSCSGINISNSLSWYMLSNIRLIV